MAILEVSHIEKHFGRTNVLKDVSFSMEEGTALAIIGSSGSGKTTLLRMIMGEEETDEGTVTTANHVAMEKLCLMHQQPEWKRMRICAENVCILAWCFSHSICFHSIQRYRM